MKVKVRGIYSTAITKLLLDKKIEITQAADALRDVFKIEQRDDEPDVIIEDLETKDGFYVYGEGSQTVIDILKNELKSSVFYKEDVGKIYCGLIKSVDQQSKTITIDLGDNTDGILDLKDFWGYVKPGTKIMVQSKGTYSGRIILSTQLRLFGKDLVIIKNGFTKMSKGIRSKDGRNKLYEIAKNFNLKDWGILWVQGAENREESILKDELSKLLEQEKEISAKFNEMNTPGVIYEGINKYFVLIDYDDKVRLDNIRKKIMPTIKGHHSLKSAGYAILTDFSEEILDKADENYIVGKLYDTLMRYGPIKNKAYKLVFTRLNGTSYKVEGLCKDLTVGQDNIVERLELVTRNSYGERTYVIDTKKNYVSIEENGKIQRLITLKPEIFPKFAKIVEFDVIAQKEGDKEQVINKERIDRLISYNEIGDETATKIKRALEEAWH